MEFYTFVWIDRNEGIVEYHTPDPDIIPIAEAYTDAFINFIFSDGSDTSMLDPFVGRQYSVEIVHPSGIYEMKTLIPFIDPDELKQLHCNAWHMWMINNSAIGMSLN